MTLNEARTAANITSRSLTLWTDGYNWKPAPTDPAVYLIYRPGSEVCDYAVDSRTGFCTCKSYEHRKLCKHSEAVLNLVREESARYDAEYAIVAVAEDTQYGCDPYARY